MKIAIIGAGPAGNHAAYLLAKKGHSVSVYEKNSVIGKPVQCTGILSDYFLNLMKPSKKFVQNIVTKTRIYAPNGNYIEAKIKKNYVICRKKFDNYLADLAKKQGVKYYLGYCFKSYKKTGNRLQIKLTNKGKQILSNVDILIGADGPNSQVAKVAGLFENRNFVIGTQVEVHSKNDNVVEFYPYIGSYAWVVPVTKNSIRIGVAAYKKSPKLFKNFLEKKLGKKHKIIENQSGIIPIFNPKVRAQKDNLYLIGDAATFNKATSGGGINQGLKSAEILAESINKNYQREWKKKLYRNLYMHLILHKMMSKFSDEDWNYLIKTFSQPKMRSILYRESRDNIVKMIIKIAITEPRLFKYMKYVSL